MVFIKKRERKTLNANGLLRRYNNILVCDVTDWTTEYQNTTRRPFKKWWKQFCFTSVCNLSERIHILFTQFLSFCALWREKMKAIWTEAKENRDKNDLRWKLCAVSCALRNCFRAHAPFFPNALCKKALDWDQFINNSVNLHFLAK